MLAVQQAMEALRQPMLASSSLLDDLQRETQAWQDEQKERERRQEQARQRDAAFEEQLKQVQDRLDNLFNNNGPDADPSKPDPGSANWINNPTATTGSRCRICGHTYQATRRDARFCSSTCRNAAWRRQHPTKRKYYRPLHPTCSVCGTQFEARRKTARYCSTACAQVAYRRRKAQANG